MARPVKWSRDLHLLHEKASSSRIETWSRQDIERLFNISRASAQSLMKAIGSVQMVGAAHFVDRSSLLGFLVEMTAAESVEKALGAKLSQAEPVPHPKPLRISLPDDLRQAMLPDLPPNVTLAPGRIEITADSASAMIESLIALAMVMQNDLERWRQAIESAAPPSPDEELSALLSNLRKVHASHPKQI